VNFTKFLIKGAFSRRHPLSDIQKIATLSDTNAFNIKFLTIVTQYLIKSKRVFKCKMQSAKCKINIGFSLRRSCHGVTDEV
jgi:hypothetical protein